MMRVKPVFTWANVVTTFGLVLGLVSLALACVGYWSSAAVCFILAALTDALDGFVARWLDARGKCGSSEFGRRLDPLRDRLLSLMIFPLACAAGLSLWLPLGFIFLNGIVVLVLVWLIHRTYGRVFISPWSKAATLLEFSALTAWLLLVASAIGSLWLAELMLGIMLLCAVVRVVVYTRQWLFY